MDRIPEKRAARASLPYKSGIVTTQKQIRGRRSSTLQIHRLRLCSSFSDAESARLQGMRSDEILQQLVKSRGLTNARYQSGHYDSAPKGQCPFPFSPVLHAIVPPASVVEGAGALLGAAKGRKIQEGPAKHVLGCRITEVLSPTVPRFHARRASGRLGHRLASDEASGSVVLKG